LVEQSDNHLPQSGIVEPTAADVEKIMVTAALEPCRANGVTRDLRLLRSSIPGLRDEVAFLALAKPPAAALKSADEMLAIAHAMEREAATIRARAVCRAGTITPRSASAGQPASFFDSGLLLVGRS
jgi:hypothetical protein